MPWHISTSHPRCSGFAVVKDADGSLAGCHPTKERARRQLAALYAKEEQMETISELQFDDPAMAASFSVNAERRIIQGLIIPWGKVASAAGSRWKFEPGSLRRTGDASRIKLNTHHDKHNPIAKAISIIETPAGLDATFKVARGEEGDKALALAEDGVMDGFSIEVDFLEGDSYEPDPTDRSVRLVRSGTLKGVALTGTPAFDDARVVSVAASREGGKMADEQGAVDLDGEQSHVKFETALERLTTAMADSQAELKDAVAGSLEAGIKAALETVAAEDGPTAIRAAKVRVTREPPVYRFNGTGDSIIRDAWYSQMEQDSEAKDRLSKYRQQQNDVASLVMKGRTDFSYEEFTGIQFAPQTTSTASQIIPPGYRPDLYVADLFRGRPIVAAASNGTITNATPFTVPTFTSVTTGSADHVEGTNPSDGSLAFGTKTVSPQAISGRLVLSREIVDASNPAIDQIAFQEMRESYNRQTETKVYTLLNGASGAGGTITTGFVPSGAQASTYVGSSCTPPALIAGIRKELARYPFNRFASPTAALMGQNATTILAQAADSTGRPIFPSIGATNTAGLGNAMTQGWSVDGLDFVPAWANTGVAAGDSQITIFNRSDLWVFESPLLTFRFEEKQGPANIELNIFGYFATHLLRPVGLSGIRIT